MTPKSETNYRGLPSELRVLTECLRDFSTGLLATYVDLRKAVDSVKEMYSFRVQVSQECCKTRKTSERKTRTFILLHKYQQRNTPSSNDFIALQARLRRRMTSSSQLVHE